MSIFPNPTNGDVTVRLSENLETDGEIALYDSWGRKAFSYHVEPGSQDWILPIEGQRVLDGLYLVVVKSARTLLTKRLIVNGGHSGDD